MVYDAVDSDSFGSCFSYFIQRSKKGGRVSRSNSERSTDCTEVEIGFDTHPLPYPIAFEALHLYSKMPAAKKTIVPKKEKARTRLVAGNPTFIALEVD